MKLPVVLIQQLLGQEVTGFFFYSRKSPTQLGNQAGPPPNERLLQSTLVSGSRHYLQRQLWSVPQLAVGSVIYGKKQMFVLALPFSPKCPELEGCNLGVIPVLLLPALSLVFSPL